MTPEQVRAVSERARCLYSKAEVEASLDAMSVTITARLENSNPVLLCVMNGGLFITAGLALRLSFPLQIDYLHASRYRGATSGADLQWKVYPGVNLRDRTVLVVDDILDEGATLASIVEYCKAQGARGVLNAVLVEKQHQHKRSSIQADFTGVTTPDYYLYGYGMDYKGYLRNAPGIFAIDDADK